MKPTTRLTRTALGGAVILALGGALVSCGGDKDSIGSQTTVDKEHSVTLDGNRIEPMRAKSAETGEQKVATPALPLGASTPTITLPALGHAKSALAEPQKGLPLHIGVVREVGAQAGSEEIAGLLQWQLLESGGKAAALRFVSPDAVGTRLAVDVQSLPEGAVMRFYGSNEGGVQEVTVEEAASWRSVNEGSGMEGETARLVWSQTFEGSAVTLEVELPADAAPDAVVIAVPKLSHQILTLKQAIEKDISNLGDSSSCHLNVTCEVDSLDDESRSVAKMTFSSGDGVYLCSGTLINDARSSGTPNFLTAHHCISTQEEAATLETQWFFRAWKCDTPDVVVIGGKGKTETLSGGAELRYTNSTYDTTLLKLNNKPPSGAVYAGSYYGDVLAKIDGLLGIHHPSGDLQKYSVGRIVGYGACGKGGCIMEPIDAVGITHNQLYAPMFSVGWLSGSTETGSSGSAMFVRDAESGIRYLAGVLHSGSASCDNQTGFDFYGRFGLAYKAGLENFLR